MCYGGGTGPGRLKQLDPTAMDWVDRRTTQADAARLAMGHEALRLRDVLPLSGGSCALSAHYDDHGNVLLKLSGFVRLGTSNYI
jgi:hypothetical protein